MSGGYAKAPGAPIPKRWMTPGGPIRVMGEPVEGYVMVRRPQAVPFVLSVRELLGSSRHPHRFGPFEPITSATRRKADAVRNEPDKANADRGPA